MEDGLTMKYTVKGGEIFFSRNEENVTKAAVIRAFHHARQLQRDSGPEELESSVGCYLYSVFLRIGVSGTEKTKTHISQADADSVFAAFSETFASYRKERIPSISGHWRVRLLTDDNEVYFYHGANGQDYRCYDESLTDILRQRTGIPELFGLSVKTETKSKVKSIEISLEQTATEEVKEKYANEYGVCIHDTNEWLLISSQGSITYNRRIANMGRVSLQYELKNEVTEFLRLYDDQSAFSRPKGNPADAVQDEIRKTYKMVITRDSGDTSVLEGSFDKDGLPDNWADFVGRLTDFFQDQSLGILSILVRTTRC